MAELSKRLDEMDSIWDVARFPGPVYAGAAVNVLQTVALTYLVKGRYPGLSNLPKWIALVLVVNLLPVALLRAGMDREATRPVIEEMDFFGDQHRFAPWVYAAASGNMALCISIAWLVFSAKRDRRTLVLALVLCLAVTTSPVWLSRLR